MCPPETTFGGIKEAHSMPQTTKAPARKLAQPRLYPDLCTRVRARISQIGVSSLVK